MNGMQQSVGSTPATQHAVRLWTRRHSGRWSGSDDVELRTWLDASAENRAAYDQVAAVWNDVGSLEGRFVQAGVPLNPHRSSRVWAVAAVLATLLLLPLWHRLDHWWNGVPIRWVTRSGQPTAISLSDRTQIVLDADSELVVKLGAGGRRVSLVRGGAFFSVEHHAWRPFEVTVGSGSVTDLGTRFEIEKLQNVTRIAVSEGRVGVATRHGEMQLREGQAGGYDERGLLQPVQHVETASPELWSQGRRQFDATPLAEVVEILGRYHQIQFTFADPRLKGLRLSGTFGIADLPLFLHTLSTALPVEARWTGTHSVELVDPTAPDG